MYDGSHVMGLFGQHFQNPLAEGTDILTGSIHKTFFGTQRGIVASNMGLGSYYSPLWECIERSSFPGSNSNHHPGTLVGAYAAAIEMLSFRDPYQQQVLKNAKAFALALHNCELGVEGDSERGYTETHQVILNVGKGRGPEIADRLEQANIITNSQGLPYDASFSDASGIRLGVQEMTR